MCYRISSDDQGGFRSLINHSECRRDVAERSLRLLNRDSTQKASRNVALPVHCHALARFASSLYVQLYDALNGSQYIWILTAVRQATFAFVWFSISSERFSHMVCMTHCIFDFLFIFTLFSGSTTSPPFASVRPPSSCRLWRFFFLFFLRRCVHCSIG